MDVTISYCICLGFIFTVHSEIQNVAFDSRLKVLESKVQKVDVLLKSLKQICSTVDEVEKGLVDLDDGQDIEDQNSKENRMEKANLKDFVPTIKVVSVESSGLNNDSITVRVIFRSENECDIRWNVRYENSTYLAFEGNRQVKTIGNGTMRLCAANISLPDTKILEWLFAVIYGPEENVQLSFNITALSEKGTEPLREFEYRILKFSPTMVLTDDMLEEVEITVEVTSNVIEAMNEDQFAAYSFFTYINTTASPPEYNEAWSFSNDYIKMEIKNGSDNKLVIRVGKELAIFGGYLSVRVEQRGIENKYLLDHKYGLGIRFINQETNSIMPTGVIAIQTKKPIQYHRGQYHSLSCLGASIPTPNVALFKVKSDGKMKQLPVDFERSNDFLHSIVVNFSPTDAMKPDGTYVCRVTLGSKFIDTKFSVTQFVEISFDEKKSGNLKTSLNVTLVSCKVFGIPHPELELRVNDEFGEDLMKSKEGSFKHRVTKRKNSSKVTLTIKPPDPDIATIYCVAKQIIYGRIGLIKVFPITIK